MQHDLPLTRYLCALVEVSEGKATAASLRERWAKGEFKGVRPDWAKEYASRFNIGKGS